MWRISHASLDSFPPARHKDPAAGGHSVRGPGRLPVVPGRLRFGRRGQRLLSWVRHGGPPAEPDRGIAHVTAEEDPRRGGTALVVLLGGVGVWAATDPGSYGRSGNGCVNVTVPSTTGGAILHDCGAAAQALCERAFAHHDRIALLAPAPVPPRRLRAGGRVTGSRPAAPGARHRPAGNRSWPQVALTR